MAKQKRRARASTAARKDPGSRWLGWPLWIVIGVLAAGGAFLLAREQATGGGDAVEPPARGLPHTPDYHSLLVDASDSDRLLLGTHVGVYESTNGGLSWRFAALEGKDAMHLAREDDGTVWVAGHNVLERSEDGGRTWTEVRPEGLPGLDVHGFALVPADDSVVYAAVAGEGLYRSTDGGATFELRSEEVGPSVTALAVTPEGRLLAADADRVVASLDSGRTWSDVADGGVLGLAVAESEPPRVLAGGESGVALGADGRSEWKIVHPVSAGAGPVAFAPSDASVAYAVGFDRKLYRSEDGGETWAEVG